MIKPANSRRAIALAAGLVALGGGLLTPAGARPSALGAPTKGVDVAAPRTTPTHDLGAWGDFYPASPATMKVKQPDGSTFSAQLTNAEIGGHLESGGFTVVKGDDGWWRYAQRGKDKALVATRARAGLDAVPAGVNRSEGRQASVWDDASGADMRAGVLRQLQIASAKAQQEAAVAGGPRVFRFPVLMLATWFDKAAGQTSPQFQPGTNTTDYVKKVLDGFGGNPSGSLTEFYFESSFGQFLVQVDVFGPFVSQRSKQDPCYYGGIDASDDPLDDLDPLDNIGPGGLGAAGMAIEAVPQADLTVNFKNYDNDGDGYVDFMGIVHSGADMATTGDPCNTWSHALPISALGEIATGLLGVPPGTFRAGLQTLDGVKVDRVFTMPEFAQKGERLQIGVAAHEMAHALGEPDYYATNYVSSGDGDFDIMSGGSYLGNPDGSNPALFNPTTRIFQGWLTPTIVHGDVRALKLEARNKMIPGYKVGTADPNLILVPTRWIKVGQTDDQGHTWTAKDVFGLANDGTKGYVIEGYYLELIDRTAVGPKPDPRETRAPYFDRAGYGSGVLTWHFDYWLRSNVTTGYENGGQNDPDRMQMDVVEFDRNDNTQEIALNYHRGEYGDLMGAAATGITSGTHQLPPGYSTATQPPQKEITWTGTVPPLQSDTHNFTVDNNPGNVKMNVSVVGKGDCTLSLFHNGVQVGATTDSGSVGAPETISVDSPAAGSWSAVTGDFAACLTYTGTVTFEGPGATTKGAADTWSNFTKKPTGWAFTNVRPTGAEDATDSVEQAHSVTLDVLNLTGKKDVSPGFVTTAANPAGGRNPLVLGKPNPMVVPVFSNGSLAPGGVTVTVKNGGTGAVIATGTVTLGGFDRKDFAFSYTPASDVPVDLVTTVDPAAKIAESSEDNNVQRTVLRAVPANAKVLVVDDDGQLDSEDALAGGLSSLGIPYAVADRSVDTATMKAYQAVIWESSIDRGPGQTTAAERAAIAAYLDGGGRLLFTSNRMAGATYGDDPATAPTWLKEYFGADVAETDTYGKGFQAVGTGDLIGTASTRVEPFTVRPFNDTLTLASSSKGTAKALATIKGTGKAKRDGQLLGVRLDATAAKGGFKTALLSWNLAQDANPDDTVRILRGILGNFGVTGGAPLKPTSVLILSPSVRSSVNHTAIPIRAVVLGGGAPSLTYRKHGSTTWVTVPMVKGAEAGTYTAVIPASFVTPDGVDYAIVVGKVSDPRAYNSGGAPRSISVPIG